MSQILRKRCIYCDQVSPLTKEHMFGKWLTEKLSENAKLQTINSITGRNISLRKGVLDRKNRAPHRASLRVVCKKCNNGWMSVLQEGAKCKLTDLFRGVWPSWQPEDILNVANWAILVAMTLEFADPDTVVASKEERQIFKERGYPPEHWLVFVGFHNLEREGPTGCFWHRQMYLFPDDLREDFEKGTLDFANNQFVAQITTFIYGSSFFHVAKLQINQDVASDVSRALGMRVLWPNGHVKSEVIQTPPILSREQIVLIGSGSYINGKDYFEHNDWLLPHAWSRR